jgi:hypothetical protein
MKHPELSRSPPLKTRSLFHFVEILYSFGNLSWEVEIVISSALDEAGLDAIDPESG